MKKYKIFDESFEDKNSEQSSELSALNPNLGSTIKPNNNLPIENKLVKNSNNVELTQPITKPEVKVLYSNAIDKQIEKNITGNLDKDEFTDKKIEGKNVKNSENQETSSYHHVNSILFRFKLLMKMWKTLNGN